MYFLLHMYRWLIVLLFYLFLSFCIRKGPATANLMTACSIEHPTPFGDVSLRITYSPTFSIDFDSKSQSRQGTSGSVVKGYFEIYDDVTMVEVQDEQSGNLVERTVCVCLPRMRHYQPCRNANRIWLRQ